MTHAFCRMPLAPEMNSFQAEIRSNQRLVTGGDLQDGAVISDASYKPPSAGRAPTYARDQSFFS